MNEERTKSYLFLSRMQAERRVRIKAQKLKADLKTEAGNGPGSRFSARHQLRGREVAV